MASLDPYRLIDAGDDLLRAADAIAAIGGRAQGVIDDVSDNTDGGPLARSNAEHYARNLVDWAGFAQEHAVDFLANQGFLPPWPPPEALVARYSMFTASEIAIRIGRGERVTRWVYQYYTDRHRAWPPGAYRPPHLRPPYRTSHVRPRQPPLHGPRGRPQLTRVTSTEGRFANRPVRPYRALSFGGNALGVIAGVFLFVDRYNQQHEIDAVNHPDLTDRERALRAFTSAGVTAGFTFAGAGLGSSLGSAIGGLFGGVGAPIGGTIGGVAGAWAGSWVGDRVAQPAADAALWVEQNGLTPMVFGAGAHLALEAWVNVDWSWR